MSDLFCYARSHNLKAKKKIKELKESLLKLFKLLNCCCATPFRLLRLIGSTILSLRHAEQFALQQLTTQG